MKLVIQRVLEASVSVDEKIVGEIQQGLLCLVGITNGDDEIDIDYLISKVTQLRIFNDEFGKMNLSILDAQGSFLIISQFTLFASTQKGNRPSYLNSAKPEIAIPMYELFIEKLKIAHSEKVETGIFGADMKVSLINDGPVTIILDSKNRN